MPNKEVVDYISNAVSQGYNLLQIRKHLIEHDFPLEVVDEAINEINNPTAGNKKANCRSKRVSLYTTAR